MDHNDHKENSTNFNALAYMTVGNMSEKRMEVAGKLSFDLVNMLQLEIESNKLQVNEVQVILDIIRNLLSLNKNQLTTNQAKELTVY